MVTCGKSFCNHCEKIFNFKNKFHNYIRSHECQKERITRLIIIFIFVTKSISFHKFNLLIFVFIESIALKVTIIVEFFLRSTSVIKSDIVIKTVLTLFFISETIFNDANTTIKKKKIKFNTHISAAKSKTPYKINLLIFVSVENIVLKVTIILTSFFDAKEHIVS